MSSPNFEQIASAQKANAEVMTALLRTALNGMERLTALNMAATRDFLNSSMSNTQRLLAAKDANALGKLQSDLAQPGMEKLMDYSRSIYDLVSDMQKDVTAVIESQYSTFTANANSVVEKAKSATPVGGDVFAAAMQSMLGASNKAFDQMNSIAKQLSNIAEANIEAAGKVTSTAKPSATSAAAKKGVAK